MADAPRYSSVAERYQGPWMSPETLASLPQLGRDYLREADPARDAMIHHFEKPEPQRRRESVVYEARLSKDRVASKDTPSSIKRRRARDERSDDGRGEQSGDGRGSSMVGKDKPTPELRPPEHIARSVDRSAFKSAWMKEQRDAAFAANQSAKASGQAQEFTYEPKPPSRSEPSM